MELYTAVGLKTEDKNGRFLVSANGGEYILAELEPFIWASLVWRFVETDKVSMYTQYMMDQALWMEGRKRNILTDEFEYGFRRLKVRGLIVAGQGDCQKAAITDILKRCDMEIAGPSARDCAEAFWISILSGNGLRASLRVFQRTRLTKEEQTLMSYMAGDGKVESLLAGLNDPQKQQIMSVIGSLYKKKCLSIARVKGG